MQWIMAEHWAAVVWEGQGPSNLLVRQAGTFSLCQSSLISKKMEQKRIFFIPTTNVQSKKFNYKHIWITTLFGNNFCSLGTLSSLMWKPCFTLDAPREWKKKIQPLRLFSTIKSFLPLGWLPSTRKLYGYQCDQMGRHCPFRSIFGGQIIIRVLVWNKEFTLKCSSNINFLDLR